MTAVETSLAETALAFAKEVLGWEDAYIAAGSINAPASDDGQNEIGIFPYHDLTVITTEVHKWCKAHFCQWAVFGNSRHEKFEWLAFVLPFDDFWEARCDTASSPQQALLTACVEAARKLRAG